MPFLLNDSWLRDLPAFLEQRSETALNHSVGAISDSKVRMEVLEDLKNILKSSGNERIKAMDNLIMRGISNAQVSMALGYLIAQDRFIDNPFLLVARAKLDTENVIRKSGPGYDTLIQPLLSKAVKITGEVFDPTDGKNHSLVMTHADAAYINREAAWMFAQIGKDKDFQQRDWIARFYGMSDQERAGLKEGDVINVVSPVPNAMSTPRPGTDAERKLIKLKDEREQVEKFQRDMDKGRGISETNDPRSNNRTELDSQTTETTETKGSTYPNQSKKDDYPRGQNQRMPLPGKVVGQYNTPVGQEGRVIGNALSGISELFIRGLNGLIFLERMAAVTKYIAEKERLENIIEGERRRVVPLKPLLLEKLIADFQRHGRKTSDSFEKEKILKIVIKLKNMREESYAMWK